jgi:hypothetical protein
MIFRKGSKRKDELKQERKKKHIFYIASFTHLFMS